MSHTYHLVCDETKKRIWIGQGWKSMTTFYSGELETMEALIKFLNDHRTPHILRFVNSTFDENIYDYDEYT